MHLLRLPRESGQVRAQPLGSRLRDVESGADSAHRRDPIRRKIVSEDLGGLFQ
jgi:hypothetical protein